MNVLSVLTAVSLVTVTLSVESDIHGEYDVTEIARGSKAGTVLGTAVIFLRNQLRICQEILAGDARVVYFFGGTAYLVPVLFAKLVGKTVIIQPRGDVPLTLQLEWSQEYPDTVARLLAALVRALEVAADYGFDDVHVRGDSQLVVKQVRGEWDTNDPGLRERRVRVRELLDRFDEWSLDHVPREINDRADELANQAFDDP